MAAMASSSDLFIPVKFHTSVQLKPNELGPNIEEIIYTKLKNNLENMCSKHGFIRKGSIKIIKRSAGLVKVAHFNGNIAYELYCIAEICNPAQGSIIKCRVKAKNSLGLLANGFYDNLPILEIIVPKISAGIQSEINIDTVNIGDEISVEVVGKKFQLYDKHISIIGKAIKEKGKQVIKNVVDGEDEGDVDNENNDTVPIFDDKSDLNVDIIDPNEQDDEFEEEIPDEDVEEEDEEEDEEEEEIEADDFGDFEDPEEFVGEGAFDADEDYE
jgi:DNA-directed RNA polymerase subunit E'/Rpb7